MESSPANPLARPNNSIVIEPGRSLNELEYPEQRLNLLVRELDERLRDLSSASVSSLADEKRLKLEIEQFCEMASKWKSRPTLALESGNEELARQALDEKEANESKSLERQRDWEAQKKTTRELKESLKSAKKRVDEAKRKCSLSLARHKSASIIRNTTGPLTSQTSRTSIEGIEAAKANEAIDRLNDKITELEADMEVGRVLNSESVAADLDRKFLELERRKKGDQALDDLKASLAERKKADPTSRVADLRKKLEENK